MDRNVSARFGSLIVEVIGYILLGNDGHKNGGKCKLKGVLGSVINDLYIDPWLKMGHRCTLGLDESWGSFEDKTELKGLISNGSVDAILTPSIIYETKDDTIEYTSPLYEDFIKLACAYRYSEDVDSDVDLLDAYFSFQPSFYVLIVLTFFAFIIAWNVCSAMASKLCPVVKQELIKARLPSYWTMICAILDQDQFPNVSKVSFTILSLCFSLFFYITIDCYMLNSMSTDLVVPIEPVVVRSLEDVLKRSDVSVFFYGGSEEETFFKNAENGTVEQRIWDEKRHSVSKIDLATVQDIWEPVKNQHMVMFNREYFIHGAANIGITTTRNLGDDSVRCLLSDTGHSYTESFMIHPNAPEAVKMFLAKRVSLASQTGLLEWVQKVKAPISDASLMSEINIDRFVSKSIFYPESGLPEVKITNVIKIFKLLFFMIVISIVALLLELLYNSCDHKKGPKIVAITV